MVAAIHVRREQLTEINAALAIVANMSFIIGGTAMRKLWSIGETHISRRSLLQGAAAVGSVPVLATSMDPAWAAKMSKLPPLIRMRAHPPRQPPPTRRSRLSVQGDADRSDCRSHRKRAGGRTFFK